MIDATRLPMTTQPTQDTPMDTPRDPHLPPPAVVDWLLEQNWPGEIPVTRIDYRGGNPTGVAGSTLLSWQQAYVDIGADAGGRVFLCPDALDALRKDQSIRQAAFDQKRQACKANEMAKKAEREQERIFKLDEKARACPLAS
jgi:hypothetical protein